MSNLNKLFLFLTLLIVSCQDTTSKLETKEAEKANAEIKEPALTIEFNFKTNKPDVFKIMMNNIEVDELQKKNIYFFENVTPSTTEDSITANFDPGNISNNILINIGNKVPKEVEIVSVVVTYGKKSFNISSVEDLDKYLAFNKFIDINGTSKTITTKRVEGALNPVIYFRRSFIDMLKKQ